MDVFEHFACYTNLPIRLKDVAAQVTEAGGFDEFTYHEVNVDPRILEGMSLVYFASVDGEKRKVAQILVSSGISDWSMKRVIYCKEMIHTLDTDQYSATTKEAVSKLIDGVVVPGPFRQATKSTQSDMLGFLYALLILLPRDALDVLQQRHKDGLIGVEDIARLAQIPTEYARVALSPEWIEIANGIQ